MGPLLIPAQASGCADLGNRGNDLSPSGFDGARLSALSAILETTLLEEHQRIPLRAAPGAKERRKKTAINRRKSQLSDRPTFSIRCFLGTLRLQEFELAVGPVYRSFDIAGLDLYCQPRHGPAGAS